MPPKHEPNDIHTVSPPAEVHDSSDNAFFHIIFDELETDTLRVELAEAQKKIQELTQTTTALRDSNNSTIVAFNHLVAEMESQLLEGIRQSDRLEEDDQRHKERIRAIEKELVEVRSENGQLKESNTIMRGINGRLRTQCEVDKRKLSEEVLCIVEELAEDLQARRDATRDLLCPLVGLGKQDLPDLPRYLDDPEVAQKIVDHYEARMTRQVEAIRQKLKKI
ncbi:hypothetical protein PG996_015495 [Apiospora saccharicola]|uniref:Uncharacterized protein n=1 Tax=Apiospora saccharicola TaxID=335842 RepID=A0ABR1TL95_9PEZI